jgi:transposase
MVTSLRRRNEQICDGARVGPSRLDGEKKSIRASEQWRPDVEAKRQAFWDEVLEIPIDRLVFLDESGCNAAMTPRTARSPRGQRAEGMKPFNRGDNVSIVGAIRLSGVVQLRPYVGAINRLKFRDFVKVWLLPELTPGDTLVMDNLRVHKDPVALEMLESAGVRVLFQPPYSPEFNPIEMYWSAFKNTLRKYEARSLCALITAVLNVRERVSFPFHGIFAACGFE